MENQNPSNGQQLDQLDEMLQNYNAKPKTNTNTGGVRRNSESVLQKYYSPRRATESFRALPLKEGVHEKFFIEAYFHKLQVNTFNKEKGIVTVENKTIYCPRSNDPLVQLIGENGQPMFDDSGKPVMVAKRCPICERYNELLKTQDTSILNVDKALWTEEQKQISKNNGEIFKNAVKYKARKHYILRGIDKGMEAHGVKFWRIADNSKKEGAYDQLMPVIGRYKSETGFYFNDKDNGCDFEMTTAEVSSNYGTYFKITSIFPKKNPLSYDPAKVSEWLADSTSWRDVFKAPTAPGCNTERFLELVLENNTPYFNNTLKKWVFPNHPELENAALENRNFTSNTENIGRASDADYYNTDQGSSYASYVNNGQSSQPVQNQGQVYTQQAQQPVQNQAYTQQVQQPPLQQTYVQSTSQQGFYNPPMTNGAQQVQNQPEYVQQQPIQNQGQVYSQPVEQQMQQPVYTQPTQQPVYTQPVQQPTYTQTVQQPVQQPVYTQPVQQPVQQPVYTQPAQQVSYDSVNCEVSDIEDLPF